MSWVALIQFFGVPLREVDRRHVRAQQRQFRLAKMLGVARVDDVSEDLGLSWGQVLGRSQPPVFEVDDVEVVFLGCFSSS